MKKSKTHLLRAYFFKLLTSPNIYIGVLGIALLAFFSRFASDWNNLKHNIISNFDCLLNIDSMRKTIVIFGAIPFAANFADEWKNSVTTSVVLRCGRKYAVCNIVCVFISTLITVFLGLMLFSGIASLFAEPYRSPFIGSVRKPFAPLLGGDFPFLYIVYKSLVIASSCGAWSVMGLAVSSFFPNKYVAVSAPIVISYLSERVTFFLPMPLCVVQLQISELEFDSLLGQLLYSAGFFVVLAAVGGIVFYAMLKRRVQNEIA